VSQHAAKDAPGGIGSNFDVAADPSGNVWVADQSNARVVQFDHNGNWIKTIGRGGGPQAFQNYPQGCGGGSMERPTNLLVDGPADRLYVSDPNCRDIYVYDLAGHYLFAFNVDLTSIGVTVPVVRGIDMDDAGHIYVIEQNSRRVLIFDTAGQMTGMFAKRADNLDPRGLTVDNVNDWIYVVDGGGADVYRYDFAGNMLVNFNSAGTTRFDSPRYIDVDPAGNIYIGDTWAYRVWKLSKTLAVLPWATAPQPPPNGGFNQINGIGIDPGTGRLYAVDTFENRMQAFATKDGSGDPWHCLSAADCPSFLFKWGKRGYNLPSNPNVINYPRGLTANEGGVWLGDAGSVLRYDADGNFIARWSSQGTAAGQHRQIFGMAAVGNATSGVVYTTDVGNCRLQKFDYAGNLLAAMGSCGNGANQMNGPKALAVVNSNNVWVADSLHNKIVLWDLTTKTIIKQISGPVAGKAMSTPTGLAIDAAGTHLYIADTGNNRIVRVRLSDMTQELASNGSDLPAGAWNGPQDMEFGPDGLLYVSDRGQHVYVLRIN
jgi:DNA-binding beta-propeller fold protein YncE